MGTRKPVRIVHPELWVAPAVSALLAVAFLNSRLRLRAATARTASTAPRSNPPCRLMWWPTCAVTH